jgi:hypothetical protein
MTALLAQGMPNREIAETLVVWLTLGVLPTDTHPGNRQHQGIINKQASV